MSLGKRLSTLMGRLSVSRSTENSVGPSSGKTSRSSLRPDEDSRVEPSTTVTTQPDNTAPSDVIHSSTSATSPPPGGLPANITMEVSDSRPVTSTTSAGTITDPIKATSNNPSVLTADSPGDDPPNTVSLIAENKKRALADLGVHCTLSIATIGAGLGLVPFLGPVVEGLTKVYQAVEKSRVNRAQWELLRGRCTMVMYIVGDRITDRVQQNYPGLSGADRIRSEDYPELTDGTRMLDTTLKAIQERVDYYNKMNNIVAFLQFRAISDEIRGYFEELDHCLTLFSLEMGIALRQWSHDFSEVQAGELAKLQSIYDRVSEVTVSLNGIETRLGDLDTGINSIASQLGTVDRMDDKVSEILELLKSELNKQSDVMQNPNTAAYTDYVGAQKAVRTIVAVTQLRPAAKMLTGEQCIPDGIVPIASHISCDVFSASLLNGEKVAKKVFRIGSNDREAVDRYSRRFKRIAELWNQFNSDYTLSFYGFGEEPFGSKEGTSEGSGEHCRLYTIAPLMKNSDAVKYLKSYRNNPGMKKNILRIITDAARGLDYLHKHEPPVVHSRMRGSNVLITDSGGGILSGFSSIKEIETDTTGSDLIAEPVMTGKSEDQRWMAPELFTPNAPPLKTESDVWGWAMTALELVSGSVPYHLHKQTMTVMLTVQKGPPKRKDYAKFNIYAYHPDEMWALLDECWSKDPDNRPTMDKVVERLEKIAEMPEHGAASD